MVSTIDAKRKKPGTAKTAKKGGGRPRGQHEVQDLTDQVETAMLYGQGRHAISKALGKYLRDKGFQPTDTEVPLGTVDDYMRRVKERWREEGEPTRADARRRQIRRLNRQLLKAQDDKRWTDAIRLEGLISKVEGTEAPRKIELSNPPGDSLKVTMPRSAPTSDDLRRELTDILARNGAIPGAGGSADG